ncbi:MAG TPA: M48 family metallopeptidase [Vicinamibacterales bacterium]|nr:M48 family metallopeptidase [Vicinamibacterales bacterium]
MANEDKATRYQRLQRRASIAAAVAAAAALVVLLLTGGAVSLRRMVAAAVGGGFVLTTAGYAVALGLLIEAVQLPFAYYQGITLERRYGLSTHTRAHWWLDRAKGLTLTLGFGAAAALIVWALLRAAPEYWWIFAAAGFGVVAVVLAQAAPVWLMPIFYQFTPLDRPALAARLVTLARRANADVVGVFEWRLSDRTRKANAALAGIGRTRRILLSDTLLSDHSDDEIEVILAHELAHHVYRDIWTAMALDAVLTAAGFYAADFLLTQSWRWLGLSGKGDLAAMPLVLLAAGAVTLLLVPAAHALSRFHERRADRYALELTGGADAFVSAMKRLSAQNLAEERPSRLTELLFHSHPSTSARIAAARSWASSRG